MKNFSTKDLECVKPQKIYFFEHSTFSLLQAQILVWLAKKHEVVVFHRTPCLEYWGDIKRGPGQDEPALENELLNNLGVAGKETVDLLQDLEAANGPDEVPAGDIKTETVLEKMQDAIRHRTSDVEWCRQDASVQVVGTPGVRREVEMVYNSILGSVACPEGVKGEDRPWPGCSFSDIAVIVPDMQTYRPVIEAVFNARDDVPYGLLDTTASEDSHYLRGFLSLIELGRKGLNRERLFNVLENPCVQRAMGFAREDVVKWRELTEKIGAFDGFEHKTGSAGYFDWSSALRRIRLARVANKVCDGDGNELPLVKDGEDDALKLSEVVELLYRDLADTLFDGSGKIRELPLIAPRREDGTRADCWADRLSRLAKTYLANDKDDKLENKVSASLLATLYSLGDIPRKQSFELAVAAVEHFVGGISCRKGRYLTSGVTIGSFSSLSALPFKQVYVMGMAAGGFPGRTSSSTLDIRGTGWRLGDVSAPNRNRFLFLESLMSVRDRLVLSYPNKDIEKDAEQFPSSIVLDVEKFIGKHVLTYDAQTEEKERKFQEFKGYPLLERGEAGPRKDDEKRPTDDIVWVKDDPFAGLLPTYSKAARELARARVEGKGKLPEVKKVDSENAKPRIEISAKVLAEFLKNPVRAVMRYRFGISVAGYLETDLEPDSPLGALQGPDEWDLQAKWLDPDATGAVEKEFRRLQLAGKMPTGFLGEYAKSAIMKKTENGLDAIKKFLADFELPNGEDNTLHLDFPTEFEKDESKGNEVGKDKAQEAEKMKLRFVAEIPNWKETADEVSVLVTGWLGEQGKIPKLPTESCFAAVLAYLISIHSMKSTARRLKVGVVDLKNGTTAAWAWDGIDAEKAGNYLKTLTRSFLTYEQTGGGKMVDFTGKKLLKALNDVAGKEIVWSEICGKLTAEEFDTSSSSFNNDLVIEQNLDRFKREPEETGEELKGIYKDRYELPLSGKRLDAAEKEVGHE
ncbi:MAG: exodeoxyribonuclease V subunit gamma [Kiritimatiellae bacterium]|nr:exodeoxyribonuclease V subunit gamma [Kiritimatiellia bacterium]